MSSTTGIRALAAALGVLLSSLAAPALLVDNAIRPAIRPAVLVAGVRVVPGTQRAQNIVVVVLDDVGREAVCAYGLQTCGHTEDLDALAASGIRFTNASMHALCSPTRASILTGRMPRGTGIGFVVGAAGPELDTAPANLPKALNTAGYRTVGRGKWHLSTHGAPSLTHPVTFGFSNFKGVMGQDPSISTQGLAGGPFNYNNYEWCDNNAGTCSILTTPYVTTQTTDSAIAAIAGTQPFFLYVAYNAAHVPNHCPPSSLHSYGATCNGGADNYFAMIESASKETKRLVNALDLSNTTVLVFGDNGSAAGPGQPIPPHLTGHTKGAVFQEGVKVAMIAFGNLVPSGHLSNTPLHAPDLANTVLRIAGAPAGLPSAVDSISFAESLWQGNSPGRAQGTYTETFTPNQAPPVVPDPATDQQSAEEAGYRLVRATGVDSFFNTNTDPFEATPLSIPSLNGTPREIYVRLKAKLDNP